MTSHSGDGSNLSQMSSSLDVLTHQIERADERTKKMASRREAALKNHENHLFTADNLLLDWTARLDSGERGPAAEGLSSAIIRDFMLRAWLNVPQSNIALYWLADCFERLLNHEDAHDVFVLPKRPRNRPGGLSTERAIDVATWLKITIERGYTEQESNTMAASVFVYDERHVRRLKRTGAGWAEGMNPSFDWDMYFQVKKRPLPRKKELPPDRKS